MSLTVVKLQQPFYMSFKNQFSPLG